MKIALIPMVIINSLLLTGCFPKQHEILPGDKIDDRYGTQITEEEEQPTKEEQKGFKFYIS